MSTPDCDRERNIDEPSWWICHRCGSLWTDELVGADWLPLSCPDRDKAADTSGELSGLRDYRRGSIMSAAAAQARARKQVKA